LVGGELKPMLSCVAVGVGQMHHDAGSGRDSASTLKVVVNEGQGTYVAHVQQPVAESGAGSLLEPRTVKLTAAPHGSHSMG
jgi:hypothetical protein